MSSLEKAFRVVDIGPSPENREEVNLVFYVFIFGLRGIGGPSWGKGVTCVVCIDSSHDLLGSKIPEVLRGEGRA